MVEERNIIVTPQDLLTELEPVPRVGIQQIVTGSRQCSGGAVRGAYGRAISYLRPHGPPHPVLRTQGQVLFLDPGS